MRRVMSIALIAGFSCLVAIVPVSAASAATPYSATFDSGYRSSIDRDVCAASPWGFKVHVVQHEYGFLKAFLDGSGDVTGIEVHIDYDATISANGITLIERDTWNNHFAADGSVVATGRTVHIQGLGGIVQHDAGRIEIAPDGSILGFDGPHPQLAGESFCPALVP